MSELCKSINPSKADIHNLSGDTKVSFIDMAALSNNGYIESMVDKTLSEVRAGSYTYFAENDIIIAKITPCMENGKCAIAKGLTNGIGFGSSEYHVFRANDNVEVKYLFDFLNRNEIRQQAAARMTGASGHRRVPVDFYINLSIPVPSKEEQQRIIAEIEGYESVIAQARAIMDGCAARKQAILDKYLK